MTIATAFSDSVTTISTSPAAAAFVTKSWSGRETQLNIWIGSTVNGECSHSNETNGGSALTGDGGRNAMKVSAPMVISGAVSPMARDSAMMMPVAIPPTE